MNFLDANVNNYGLFFILFYFFSNYVFKINKVSQTYIFGLIYYLNILFIIS